MTHKKGLLMLSAALLSLGFATRADAANYVKTDTVKSLILFNGDSNVSGTGGDYLRLTTLTTHSTCAVSAGWVALELPTRGTDSWKAMVSAIQGAQLAGKQLEVGFTNTPLTGGFCTVVFIRSID